MARHLPAIAGVLTLFAQNAAQAQIQSAPPPAEVSAQAAEQVAPHRVIVLEAGSGKVLALHRPAASVFAADPKVVEVRPASPNTLFVFGLLPGRTTVAAMDGAGKLVAQYELVVKPSAFSANEAVSAIQRVMPGRNVRVQSSATGLLLNGNVETAAEAEAAAQIAKGFLQSGQTIENRMSVQQSIQVGLRVRIAEVSRQITRELGVNWSGLGNVGRFAIGAATGNALAVASGGLTTVAASYVNKGIQLDSVIDALAQDNLVRVLAEPNLTARSGESASFLVGGEYPIPVSATLNNTVTVEYKQYGVSLSFVPTVLSSGLISLHVRPEVSALTTDGAVTFQAGNSSLQIPALTVRRAETTIELGSGQSFAMAGLLQDSVTQSNQNVPWLGEVPILGALFRSDSFQHKESELVIVVTPYIVKPVSDPGAIRLPTDNYRPPNDLERILLMRQQALNAPAIPIRIPGDAGFIVQ